MCLREDERIRNGVVRYHSKIIHLDFPTELTQKAKSKPKLNFESHDSKTIACGLIQKCNGGSLLLDKPR